MRNRPLSGRLKASKKKRRTIDDISVGFQAIGQIFTGLLFSSTRRSNEQTSESIAARIVELSSSDGLVLQDAKSAIIRSIEGF